MKLSEQYAKVREIKNKINEKLQGADSYQIKDLVLWLVKDEIYQKIKTKDNQLMAMDLFMSTWLYEKQNENRFESQGDIFFEINSLEDIESKYFEVKSLAFRLEQDVPYEYCIEKIDNILKSRFSSFAIFTIFVRESEKKEDNIIKLARLFEEKNELVKAIGLLQKATEKFPSNQGILIELAGCWVTVKEWKRAYDCLTVIANPNEELKEMMIELEKIIRNEGTR